MVILCLLSSLIVFVGCDTGERTASGGNPGNPGNPEKQDSSKTYLLLDFEDSAGVEWDQLKHFGPILDYSWRPAGEYNQSAGVSWVKVSEGSEKGGVKYDLTKPGRAVIPVTKTTRVAWSWYIVESRESNGLWMVIYVSIPSTGTECWVRCASWRKWTHDALNTYYDPYRTWIYHEESIFDYINRRWGPIEDGDALIECIGFGVSGATDLEARLDNIWIGEAPAPVDVNTISHKQQYTPRNRPDLEGFSFGYLDGDDTPDRIDIYGNRLEVIAGRQFRYEKAGGDTIGSGGSGGEEKEILLKVDLGRDRAPTSVSIVDMNDDGASDILVHFEDLHGNRHLRNRIVQGGLDDLSGQDETLEYNNEGFYGADFADLDGDADIDAFMINPYDRKGRFGGVRLLRRDGDTFTEWTDESGVVSENAFGGAFSDFDGDGDQDLFVAYKAYEKERNQGRRPYLYVNDGSGKFTFDPERIDIGEDLLLEGVVAADFDNDADIDLYLVVRDSLIVREDGRSGVKIVRSRLLLNDGNGYFSDKTDGSGIWPAESQSAIAGDLDQDGDIDIYQINDRTSSVYYRNDGSGFFRGDSSHPDFTYRAVKDVAAAVGGLAVDFDSDGDLDIALRDYYKTEAQLLSNGCADGGYVKVRLRGLNGNSAGIGAKVYLYEAGSMCRPDHLVGFREIRSGRGFGMHGPPVAHFGIDSLQTVDLFVVFPSVDGNPPVQVAMYGVKRNSSLYIVETDNALLKIWYSWPAARFRYLFVSGLFRVPAWVFFLVLFVVLSMAGLSVRAKLDSAAARRIQLVVCSRGALFWIVGFAILLVAISFYRSWLWSVPSVLGSFVIIATDHDLGRVIRRLTGVKRDSEMEETLLVQKLSRILHAEQRFSFLIDFTNADSSVVEKYRYILDAGLDDLDRTVEMMRHVFPSHNGWKEAARDLDVLKEIFRSYIAVYELGDESAYNGLNGKYRKSIDSFLGTLREVREILRVRQSVDINGEWESLIQGRKDDLKESGIELSANLAEVAGTGVHLTAGEFRDIFSNLLTNSIWAVSDTDDRRIRVETSKDRMHLKVRWLDSGRGIDPEIREILFSRDVKSQRPGGRGLGCHIAGQIIKVRRGRIRVEDPPAGWSTSIVIKFIRTK
ncbi:MAG: VCBS repeat-containing protein [Bacteroidales bacterium]|nr:VCBS repeat-containing protein [Candidatus Latescibacterota bacterium]